MMTLRMRALNLSIMLVSMAGALGAQTYITAGDNNLSLSQVLRFHPEGMILSLPSAQGQSLAQAIEEALDKEPALTLQLTSQELEPGLKVGREFQRLQGWSPEKPHWALVGPDKHIYAEGTTAPTATSLREAYRQSSLSTRADILREFLKTNRDHTDGWARLILEIRSLAEHRTEGILGPKPSPETEDPLPPKDPPKGEHSVAPAGEAAVIAAAPQAPLTEVDDARIWSEYATLYERFIKEGDWLDSAPGEAGPIPLASELSSLGDRSPTLRALALQLLPKVEEQLRNRPTDEHRWQVWMSLRSAAGAGHPSKVLEGLKPLPGVRRWPPAAALNAFVEDARHSGDWREVEPLLQAAYDQNMELLRAMESAAREDANQGWTQAHGSGGEGLKVQMGNYFGFGGWNSDVSDLLEAKMRLGKNVEADRVFQELYARVPKLTTAKSAAALAMTCGVPELADKWGRMGH